jgi:isohexenylglutaconyl-CoA hydratase
VTETDGSSEAILSRLEDGILYLTLNRPSARNALTAEMISTLTRQFAAIAGLPELRAVVLRGSQGHFCAGADLRAVFAGADAEGRDPALEYSEGLARLLKAVRDTPAVVSVVCEGAVLGGGLGLACVGDIVMAHRATRFSVPETSRGLPPAQIAPYLVERVGLPVARRLCLTSAQFDGVEASAIGMADDVFDGEEALQHRLTDLITDVMRCAPRANALTKHLLLSLVAEPDAEFTRQAGLLFTSAVRGAEAREGIEAFLQKRRPRWDYGSGR